MLRHRIFKVARQWLELAGYKVYPCPYCSGLWVVKRKGYFNSCATKETVIELAANTSVDELTVKQG